MRLFNMVVVPPLIVMCIMIMYVAVEVARTAYGAFEAGDYIGFAALAGVVLYANVVAIFCANSAWYFLTER